MNLGLKALACLLLYPDAVLKDNLQEIKAAVAESTLAKDQKEALEIFINHMIETPMADLQKEYGATFESPDSPPMFLEFLSGLDDAEAQALLDGAARHIAAIDAALKKEESPWAVVTGAIMSLTAMKTSEVKFERDDLLPTTEAESFDSPVRFGGNADPVQTVHFKK